MRLDHRLYNILFGFICFAIAEAGGPFLADMARKSIVMEGINVQSWEYITLRSSHAHFALFSLLQIVIGLTYPLSHASKNIKTMQTIMFTAGTLAMGPLMFVHAQIKPTLDFVFFDYLLGTLLSLHLLALISHIWGIANKKIT